MFLSVVAYVIGMAFEKFIPPCGILWYLNPVRDFAWKMRFLSSHLHLASFQQERKCLDRHHVDSRRQRCIGNGSLGRAAIILQPYTERCFQRLVRCEISFLLSRLNFSSLLFSSQLLGKAIAND